MAPKRVFIDGEAGTTGLQIIDRLKGEAAIAVHSIAPERRKDPEARRAAMAEVDAVVLCLPDAAAKESVALAESLGNRAPRLLDASTAHRIAEGWTYGFAEMVKGQAAAIAGAARVANPGCYPTGGIALLRPLTDAGLLPRDYPVVVSAISGYSGGGRAMIEAHEAAGGPPYELYGLDMEHKHLPELQHYGGLSRRPVFVPSVGHFRQGMVVTVALHLDLLHGATKAATLEEALAAHYEPGGLVKVVPFDGKAPRLHAEDFNGSDVLELRVLPNDRRGQAILVARLDNLGKGASGAAVQNLKLMLGVAA
ncbi:MAG: N-acetyl-gamma-glutamyl-phosphate reductase [Thalassobaculales bacterium]